MSTSPSAVKAARVLAPERAPTQTGVYLLCFGQAGLERGDGTVARHYLGWAANIRRRVAHHAAGTARARFTDVTSARGLAFVVARTWLGADRTLERKLKNYKRDVLFCPNCNGQAAYRRAAYGVQP